MGEAQSRFSDHDIAVGWHKGCESDGTEKTDRKFRILIPSVTDASTSAGSAQPALVETVLWHLQGAAPAGPGRRRRQQGNTTETQH